jgi:hypothetical protein
MWIKEDGKMVEVTVDHPTPPSLPKDRWEELALRATEHDNLDTLEIDFQASC